jgi:hypothetical protein
MNDCIGISFHLMKGTKTSLLWKMKRLQIQYDFERKWRDMLRDRFDGRSPVICRSRFSCLPAAVLPQLGFGKILGMDVLLYALTFVSVN